MSDVGVMLGSQTTMKIKWKSWSKYFYVCLVILAPVTLLVSEP